MSAGRLDPAAVPAEVRAVLARLQEAHEAWLVGGAVRDLLRGERRAAEDWDVATSARPEAVMKAFRRVIPTGIQHGTVTVLERGHKIEVTTYRGESAYSDARRPDAVSFFGPGGLEQDLARRDFTVNSVAWDPGSGRVVDPFGGQADLAAGRLRAVGDPVARFTEDGLRPMRAVRFAATLDMDLDPATRAAIAPTLASFRRVAVERVSQELARLLGAPRPSRGLRVMRDTGLLEAVFPGLDCLPARLESLDLPPGDPTEAAGPLARDPAVRLAGLLRPLGPSGAEAAMTRLKLPKALVGRVVSLLGELPLPPRAPDAEALRRQLARVGRGEAEVLAALWRLEARAGGAGPGPEVAWGEALVETARSEVPLAVGDLALDGRAIMARTGRRGGPWLGKALHALLDHVLAHPEDNRPERLEQTLDRLDLPEDARGS